MAGYQRLHQCRVNRLSGKSGKYRVTGRNAARAIISSYGSHFGEESPLAGRNGSATIFFTYCHLQCIFRQNYSIGQLGEGND